MSKFVFKVLPKNANFKTIASIKYVEIIGQLQKILVDEKLMRTSLTFTSC